MVAITDVSARRQRPSRASARLRPTLRVVFDVALVVASGAVAMALASRSLLTTALPVATGVVAAAVSALRFGTSPRRAAAGTLSAASLVLTVLLSSERLWAPHGIVAAAFVLAAAVGLFVTMSSTAKTEVRYLLAVTGATLLLGPAWAFRDGESDISTATGLRLLAVSIATVTFVSPVRAVRSVLGSAALILLALAGTERSELRSVELAAATGVALLIIERWWHCDLPPAPVEGSIQRGTSLPTLFVATLLSLTAGAWVAAALDSHHAATVLAAGAVALLLPWVSGSPETTAELRRRVRSLERIAGDLARTSQTDRLTMLPNREALERRLHEEIERALRHQQPLALCFVDIDHFKDVNDTHGHAVGDHVLAAVSDTLRSTVRTIDIVARYGGEEFVVIAPGTWSSDAVVLADRLRRRVAASNPSPLGWPLTISVGVASLPEHAADAETLLRKADEALYRSKRAGRDRTSVALAGELTARG